MNLILSFNNLAIGYKNQPLARGLSSELYAGETLQVTGSNGSGKTTFVKTLLGEIPSIGGDIQRAYKSLYYLKQNYQDQIHLPITVNEILNGQTKEIDFSPELKWNDLSGGQKQQVLIFKAFSLPVDLVILDEPLNHLDHYSISKVTKLINQKLAENKQLTVILISHIPIELGETKLVVL